MTLPQENNSHVCLGCADPQLLGVKCPRRYADNFPGLEAQDDGCLGAAQAAGLYSIGPSTIIGSTA